jgi:hypothetical protein
MCYSKTMLFAAILAAICGCSDGEHDAGGLLDQRYSAALEQKNPEKLTGTLIALSAEQHAAGNVAGAAESLAAATKSVTEVANPAAQAQLLVRISDAQARQGDSKAAVATLAKADSAARKASEPASKADVLVQIGSLYAQSHKQIAPAIAAVEEAQKTAGSIDDAQSRVEAYCALAKAYATLGKPADANRMLEFAATTANTLENPKRQSDSLAAVAAAQVDLKNKLGKR